MDGWSQNIEKKKNKVIGKDRRVIAYLFISSAIALSCVNMKMKMKIYVNVNRGKQL
jgi:hypothetical protein